MKKENKKKLWRNILIILVIFSALFIYFMYNANNHVITYDNVNMDKKLLKNLQAAAKEDDRIYDIIRNHNSYPIELLYALSKNTELTDYVLGFPSKKGNAYSDNIGKINSTEVPRLYQWDERWGYAHYGSGYIALNGCGPTSLAMVVAYLTNDNSITPFDIATFAYEKGYYEDGNGTSWSLITEGSKKYGVKNKELALDEGVIKNVLNKHHPIIVNVGKGDFTDSGHFIVFVGVEDNKIKVNDPYSKIKSDKLWEYDRLKGQIKNLWEFYV